MQGTYVAQDFPSKKWYAWLLLRPCSDEDLKNYPTDVYIESDYRSGYWLYINLETASVRITHEMLLDAWTRL